MKENPDGKKQAQDARSKFIKMVEVNGINSSDLAKHIKAEMGLRGFSESTFSRNIDVQIDELTLRPVKDLTRFFEKSMEAVDHYIGFKNNPSSLESFSFGIIANSAWEFYYYKNSISQKKSGIFCGLLKIGSTPNSITLKTQRNFFKGKVYLNYTGIIKFEFSLNNNIRPLLVMGNIGGITDRPSLFLVNYINLTKDLRLVGGAGIIRHCPSAHNSIVRAIEKTDMVTDTTEAAFQTAVHTFFNTYKDHYAKIEFAETLGELENLNKNLKKKGFI